MTSFILIGLLKLSWKFVREIFFEYVKNAKKITYLIAQLKEIENTNIL